ncbi:MAG: hypothetical protein HN703_00405 [Planctomycetaceae bacterium]|nr:hypothetical protein [Planctomycetaceae bacterium]
MSRFQNNPLSGRNKNLKPISRIYPKGFGSLGKPGGGFYACFTGPSGFLETHLDGLSQLLTIPSRCVSHDELCNKIHGSAF